MNNEQLSINNVRVAFPKETYNEQCSPSVSKGTYNYQLGVSFYLIVVTIYR